MIRVAAARSAGWTLIEAASAQSLLLITFLILARLLTPADYGLMAFATTILTVPQFILSNGLIPVLVGKQDLTDDDLSTAFWTSLGLGAVLTVAVLVLAGPLATMLHNPALAPVLRWSSLQFPFMALGNVPTALFQRRLQFRVFALRSAVSFIGGGGIGIYLALHGAGVWSLVGNLVVQAMIAGLMLWVGLGWRPRFTFSRASFSDMQHNIRHTVAGNIVASFTSRVDILIIGILDPAVLGYYYFVLRLLLTITVGTYVPIVNVSLPVLSKLRQDDAKLRDGLSFLIWAAQVLWMPLVAGLGATAALAVPNVFGPAWSESVLLMQIMSLAAFTTCLSQFTYQIALIKDQTATYPRLVVAQLVITVALMAIATRFGLVAIGWAYVAASAMTALLHLMLLRRLLQTSFGSLLARSASAGFATITMVLAIQLFGRLEPLDSPWLTMIIEIAGGAAVFVVALILFCRNDVARLLTTVLHSLPTKIASFIPGHLVARSGPQSAG